MNKNGGDEPPNQQWALASQVSSALVGPVVLGIILDWQFGWAPYATLTGIGVGMLSLMALLVRKVKQGDE